MLQGPTGVLQGLPGVLQGPIVLLQEPSGVLQGPLGTSKGFPNGTHFQSVGMKLRRRWTEEIISGGVFAEQSI